jgi:hypothetical protein
MAQVADAKATLGGGGVVSIVNLFYRLIINYNKAMWHFVVYL